MFNDLSYIFIPPTPTPHHTNPTTTTRSFAGEIAIIMEMETDMEIVADAPAAQPVAEPGRSSDHAPIPRAKKRREPAPQPEIRELFAVISVQSSPTHLSTLEPVEAG